MAELSIDPKTYSRLTHFAESAGVSVQAAGSDAIENWLDITSDPRLAVTALSAIAVTHPLRERNAARPAETSLPWNVSFINARRRPSGGREGEPSRRLREARAKEDGR
jgi:hypothetical protein